mmetsp:Transcript_107099/g.341800  ORF Transcript_107099/g.341800 Transcript_107099/m.341800 type:complete len:554 (-) Transcript_107099:206-1867(-)
MPATVAMPSATRFAAAVVQDQESRLIGQAPATPGGPRRTTQLLLSSSALRVPPSPVAGITPSPLCAGPLSPSALTPTKTSPSQVSAAGNAPPVKYTFIHYDSPIRTMSVLTPPRTVPSSFAPKQTLFEWLRTPKLNDRTPVCTPIMEHGQNATPSTVGTSRFVAGNAMTSMNFCMGGQIGVTGTSAVVHASAVATHYQHGYSFPVMPQPTRHTMTTTTTTSAASSGTVLRLSEYLQSPAVAGGSVCGAGTFQTFQIGAASHPMVARESQAVTLDTASGTVAAAAAAIAQVTQQRCCWQGYEAASMMPPVPPLPDPATHNVTMCGGFDAQAVVTVAAAAAAAVHFQDPAVAAAVAAAAAVVSAGNAAANNRIIYDQKTMQYYSSDTSSMLCCSMGYPVVTSCDQQRVSISVGHFPEPNLATVPGTTAPAPAAPPIVMAATPQKGSGWTGFPDYGGWQRTAGQRAADLAVSPPVAAPMSTTPPLAVRRAGSPSHGTQKCSEEDVKEDVEPQEEPAPSTEGSKRRDGGSKSRRRRGGHGNRGGGGGGGGRDSSNNN